MKTFFLFFGLFIFTNTYISQTNGVNIGFELGNTNGWTFSEGTNTNSTTMAGCCPSGLSSISAYVTTPGMDPYVPAISMVAPGGGNNSLALGQWTGNTVARARYVVPVVLNNRIFTCAYAFITSANNDPCDQKPYFDMTISDASQAHIPNASIHIQSIGGCSTGDPGFITHGIYEYKNWTFSVFDLSAYLGQNVSIEFTVGGNTNGSGVSYAYIDGSFSDREFTLNGSDSFFQNLSICESSSSNSLCAPQGYSSYSWTGPNVSGQTGQCVNVTTAGSYSVDLIQGSTTIRTASCNITSIASPTISVTTSDDNSSCGSACTGSVSVSVANPANYNWNFYGNGLSFSSANTSTFSASNLCGSTYTLVLQQTGTYISCSTPALINIQGSNSVAPTINPVNQILTCTNPTVTLNANPTFTNSFVEYIWSGPGIISASNTQTILANQPGTYTVVASNTLTGCSTTSTLNVFPNTGITSVTVNATSGGTVQCGQCVNLTPATTGTGVVANFLWASALGSTFSTQTIAACSADIYTLTITTTNSCVASTVIQVYEDQPLLNITITPTIHATCPYLSSGSIQTSVIPVSNYTYTWSDSQSNTLSSNADLFNLTGGTYYLKITDGTACAMYSYSVSNYNPTCSSLSGNIFNDTDRDCIKNTGESGLNNIKVMATPGNYWALSDANGNYTIYAPLGNYTLSQVQFPSPFIAPYCTSTLTANLNSSNSQLQNLDFADTLTSIVDGYIPYISTSGIVPGFNNKYYVGAGYTIPIGYSGILKFVKSPLLSYTTFSPSALSVNGDTVYFAVNTYSNSSQQFNIGFYAPPSLPLGINISACGYLKVNETDVNLANNTLCYNRVTIGSFDPNDKSVEPAGAGAEGYISANDSILSYIVRFQNTGTGPAVNIVIEDTLSPNLNPLTFELMGSSHNCDVAILPGNIVRWKFNNIMLPDSNSNEPDSHGFVQYRIKQKHGNLPGTQIKNTAYIYFDFNEPVVTNTTKNTIELATGIKPSLLSDSELAIYPNPTTSMLYITDKQNKFQNSTVEIKNYLGQVIYTIPFTSQIDLSNLPIGLYFMTINNKLDKKSYKIIKE